MAQRKTLTKIAVALAALGALGFLFMRSVRDSRSAPYTVQRQSLDNWTLALTPRSGPNAAMLVLRPPTTLVTGLFDQIFRRAMESLSVPAPMALPLVLQGEFDRAFAGRVAPEALLAAARSAGLESMTWQPRCLGYRRASNPTATQQLYFILFDAPAFDAFRRQIGGLAGGGDFDPAALSPVLPIGESGPTFSPWLPLRAEEKTDCVAPIAAK
jgi:hypothetical protein